MAISEPFSGKTPVRLPYITPVGQFTGKTVPVPSVWCAPDTDQPIIPDAALIFKHFAECAGLEHSFEVNGSDSVVTIKRGWDFLDSLQRIPTKFVVWLSQETGLETDTLDIFFYSIRHFHKQHWAGKLWKPNTSMRDRELRLTVHY